MTETSVPTELLFVQSFLQTFKREWTGIDRLRMDKFFQVRSSRGSRPGAWRRVRAAAVLTRTLSLTAGPLHVQTSVPGAEEDLLGRQVRASSAAQPSRRSLTRVRLSVSAVSRFLELLSTQVLQSGGEAPCGLQLHILDVYLSELAAVAADEVQSRVRLGLFVPRVC